MIDKVNIYPVALTLEGRPCAVVGDRWIVERRVLGLLDAGAAVTLVAARASEVLEALAAEGRIRWTRRDYEAGDLAGQFLAFAAVRDRSSTERIWEEAEQRGILMCAVDDPAHSNFVLPAIHRQGALAIAVSTSGQSPALAAGIRDRLAAEYGPEYAQLLELLGNLRPRVMERVQDFDERAGFWRAVLDSGILETLRGHGPDAARAQLERMLDDLGQ